MRSDPESAHFVNKTPVLSPVAPKPESTSTSSFPFKYPLRMPRCVASLLSITTVAEQKLLHDGVSLLDITRVQASIVVPLCVAWTYFRTGTLFGIADDETRKSVRSSWVATAFLFTALSHLVVLFGLKSYAETEIPLLTILYFHMGMWIALLWRRWEESVDGLTWMSITGALLSDLLIAHPAFFFGNHPEVVNFERGLGFLFGYASLATGFNQLRLIRDIGMTHPPCVLVSHSILQQYLIAIPFLLMAYPRPTSWIPSLEHTGLLLLGAIRCLNVFLVVQSCALLRPMASKTEMLLKICLVAIAAAALVSENVLYLFGMGDTFSFVFLLFALFAWEKSGNENPKPSETPQLPNGSEP